MKDILAKIACASGSMSGLKSQQIMVRVMNRYTMSHDAASFSLLFTPSPQSMK